MGATATHDPTPSARAPVLSVRLVFQSLLDILSPNKQKVTLRMDATPNFADPCNSEVRRPDLKAVLKYAAAMVKSVYISPLAQGMLDQEEITLSMTSRQGGVTKARPSD